MLAAPLARPPVALPLQHGRPLLVQRQEKEVVAAALLRPAQLPPRRLRLSALAVGHGHEGVPVREAGGDGGDGLDAAESRLDVDVKVILTPPCIFCIENH